ncbi:MAG: hypothetical protein LUQ47_06370 [Methanotrichaceae archaeon]|nr:hypothetical protein [Methanotrichaceae archaeon]
MKALIWGSHGALSQILVPETITTDENIMARAQNYRSIHHAHLTKHYVAIVFFAMDCAGEGRNLTRGLKQGDLIVIDVIGKASKLEAEQERGNT